MQLEQLFNDTEKEKLNKFVNDEDMMIVVKKVLLSAVYFDGSIRKEGIPYPSHNFALSLAAIATNDMNITNSKLGKELKIALAAVQILEKGFAKLQRFNKKKENKPEEERSNPAR